MDSSSRSHKTGVKMEISVSTRLYKCHMEKTVTTALPVTGNGGKKLSSLVK